MIGVSTASFQARAASSLESLDDLPGGTVNSTTYGVSADGTVVVGRGTSASGNEAFRWTQSTGLVGLGDLPGGNFFSRAYGVSADGLVIVGQSESANGFEAFRWTQGGGMIGLGDLPGGTFSSSAEGVNADGSVIVGVATSASGNEAFRWTQGGGMVGLGDLPGGAFSSYAEGVNGDGSVVVGAATSASGSEAFRWTQSTGMVGLGDLPGGSFFSRAYGVSADGSTVFGRSISASGNEAFRWTQSGGMVGLGDLPGGGFYSQAHASSANGSIIVGFSESVGGYKAFHWTQSEGMVFLQDILTDAGVDTTHWNLVSAHGISADGSVIIGFGDFNGNSVAYIANVPMGGLTTPEALASSLNTVAQAGQNASVLGMQSMSQSLFVARSLSGIAAPVETQSYGVQFAPYEEAQSFAHVTPAAGGSLRRSRLSAFTMGAYGFDDSPRAGQYNGILGISMDVAPGTSIGIGMIGGASVHDLAFNGDSRATTLGGTVLASYEAEDNGFRLYGSTYVAHVNVDTTRGYLNGGGLDYSSGETNGLSYGAVARIGWEEKLFSRDTSVMPYIEGSYSKTKLDGYAEKGGAFAAHFADQENDYAASHLGVELKQHITPKLEFFLRPSWGHRLSGDGDVFTAEMSGLTQTMRGDPGDRNWGEGAIGGTWEATSDIRFMTELMGRMGDTAAPQASLMLGMFVRF